MRDRGRRTGSRRPSSGSEIVAGLVALLEDARGPVGEAGLLVGGRFDLVMPVVMVEFSVHGCRDLKTLSQSRRRDVRFMRKMLARVPEWARFCPAGTSNRGYRQAAPPQRREMVGGTIASYQQGIR